MISGGDGGSDPTAEASGNNVAAAERIRERWDGGLGLTDRAMCQRRGDRGAAGVVVFQTKSWVANALPTDPIPSD